MGFTPATDSDFKPREITPEGQYLARLQQVIQLGSVIFRDSKTGKENPKHEILLGFEILGKEDSEGRPFVVFQRGTISPSEYGGYYIAKTAKLHQVCKAIDPDYTKSWSPNVLVARFGRVVKLIVSHAEKDGRTWANIDLIKPATPKDIEKAPEAKTEIVNYALGEAFPESFGKKLRERIASCLELTDPVKLSKLRADKAAEYAGNAKEDPKEDPKSQTTQPSDNDLSDSDIPF